MKPDGKEIQMGEIGSRSTAPNLRMAPVIVVAAAMLVAAFPAFGCSAVYLATGDGWLFANNEDWSVSQTYLEITPAKGENHGYVGFWVPVNEAQRGMEWSLFGGVNDQGLSFDMFSVPPRPIEASGGQDFTFLGAIMERCATVAEVLEYLKPDHRSQLYYLQLMYGDALGHSVIIEDAATLRGEDSYQICTNFRQSEFVDRTIPDYRYNTIENALGERMMLDVGIATSLLASVAQRAGGVKTVYSYIYDTSTDELTLYYLANFREVVRVNVGAEIEKGRHSYHLPSLFSYITDAQPVDQSEQGGTAVTFMWSGAPADYTLAWSTDPEFSTAETVIVCRDDAETGALAIALLVPLAVPVVGTTKRRRWLVLLLAATVLVACAHQVPPEPHEISRDYAYTVEGFAPGVTYHWRLQTERTPGIVATFTGGSFTVASP
jgi:hypothetical protein